MSEGKPPQYQQGTYKSERISDSHIYIYTHMFFTYSGVCPNCMQALGATCGAAAPRQEVDSEERWEVGARAGAEMNISRYS